MKKLKIENIILFVSEILTYLIYFIPLVSLNKYIYASTYPKQMLFTTGVEIIFALYLILCIFNRKYWPKLKVETEKGKIVWNWPLAMAILLVAVLSLTTLFSLDRHFSFWGNLGWESGLIVILHALALLLVISSLFAQDKFFWLNLLKVIFLAGLIVAGYGFIQKFIGVGTFIPKGEATATFGNVSFFTAYLIFPMFGSVLLYFLEKKMAWRIACLLVFILELVMLTIGTDNRAVWVGLATALLTIILVFFLSQKKKLIRQISLAILMILVLGAAFYSYNLVHSGKWANFGGRERTVKSRLFAWQAALDGIKARPIFGWGIENFNAVFEKYFNPKYYEHVGPGKLITEYAPGNPHNKILEVAVLNGLPSALIYLILFAGIFTLLVKSYLKRRDPISLILLALFVTYFVENIFFFDTVLTYMMFYTFLGLVSFRYFTADIKEPKDRPLTANEFLQIILIAAVVGATAIGYLELSYKPAKAVAASASATALSKTNNRLETIKAIDRVDNYRRYFVSQEINSTIGEYAFFSYISKQDIYQPDRDYVLFLIKRLEYDVWRQPYKIAKYTGLGRLYLIGCKFDKSYCEKAVDISDKALKHGSKRAETYQILTIALTDLGKKDEAYKAGDEGVKLEPDYGFMYALRARVYLGFDDTDKALDDFEKAFSLKYVDTGDLLVYARLLYDEKDYERGINTFNKIIDQGTALQQPYSYLTEFYMAEGDKDKAKDTANKTIEKFPVLKPKIDAFIKSL